MLILYRFILPFFILIGVSNMSGAADRPVSIVIHGGAGTILKEKMAEEVEKAYRERLADAVTRGHEVLKKGGSSREAVVAAIVAMEDSDLFNAGRGAVFTHEGKVELDASIMEGRHLYAGAIAGVTRIKNPILLASKVLETSPHVMLVGEGAEVFASDHNIEMVENDYFHTERRRKALERAIANEQKISLSEDVDDPYDFVSDKRGTVGAVAIDRFGDITAGTSTGGMTNKRFGRIGDSPIIGAGTYADNKACGISATGHGEYFIRAAVAHDICARVLYKGISLQEAADEVVHDKLIKMGADGGVIGIDTDGNIVYSFNSAGMYRASINAEGELSTGIFAQKK